MTQSTIEKVKVLRKATVRYSPCVQKGLSKAGKTADSAFVHSAAKYYIALKKLAEK